jgi:hypothetical protein
VVSASPINAAIRNGVYRQSSPDSIKSRDISAMARASRTWAGLSVTAQG